MPQNNCPAPDPGEGHCVPDPSITLAKFLGSNHLTWTNKDGSRGELSDKNKKATWADVLQSHAFAPDKNSHQDPPKLTAVDLGNFGDALAAKYNMHYDATKMGSACCSCTP